MEDCRKLRERELNDVTFKTIVDCFYHMIHSSKFTPGELRQALHYACWKYEMNNVRYRIIREDTDAKENV